MLDLTNDVFQPLATADIGLHHRRNIAGPVVTTAGNRHLVVVHASQATWTVCTRTGTRHLRRRGMADVIPAGETGGFTAESGCDSLVLSLSPRVVDLSLGRAHGKAGAFRLQASHMLDNPRIVHLLRALHAAEPAGAANDSLFREAMAHALASQLPGVSSGPPKRQDIPLRQVQRVLDLIETRLDRPLTIESLAREAGASSSHLRHWFLQVTGTTVHRYLMRRRVARARELLQGSTLPLAEVALAAGFAHQSHMARWLRRELGQAPLSLRRQG
jgi:AraC family transcriptional regulator